MIRISTMETENKNVNIKIILSCPIMLFANRDLNSIQEQRQIDVKKALRNSEREAQNCY